MRMLHHFEEADLLLEAVKGAALDEERAGNDFARKLGILDAIIDQDGN
jgi:hypothetical protein